MWSSLDENGQLERVESYNDGLLDGEWKQLYSNGQVRFQGKYVNNKRTGQWVWYDVDGNDTHSEIY
jgi:antitoxin component YwqK of YwqJK toxin-antitoxin module